MGYSLGYNKHNLANNCKPKKYNAPNVYHHLGLIGSLYSILQFFSLPIIGTASDVFGRKPILLITTVSV